MALVGKSALCSHLIDRPLTCEEVSACFAEAEFEQISSEADAALCFKKVEHPRAAHKHGAGSFCGGRVLSEMVSQVFQDGKDSFIAGASRKESGKFEIDFSDDISEDYRDEIHDSGSFCFGKQRQFLKFFRQIFGWQRLGGSEWARHDDACALLLEQDGDHNFGCAGMAVADQWDGLSLHLAGNFAGIMMYAAVFAAGLKFGGCAERMLVAAAVIREIWFRKQCCGNFPDASGFDHCRKASEFLLQF